MFLCKHARLSYVTNTYLLTYLLKPLIDDAADAKPRFDKTTVFQSDV